MDAITKYISFMLLGVQLDPLEQKEKVFIIHNSR